MNLVRSIIFCHREPEARRSLGYPIWNLAERPLARMAGEGQGEGPYGRQAGQNSRSPDNSAGWPIPLILAFSPNGGEGTTHRSPRCARDDGEGWVSWSGILAVFIKLIAIAFFIRVAHAADLTVIEARGVPLKSGDTVDDGKVLDLEEGQRVTLVTPDGDTIKLRGPFHQKPGDTAGGGGGSLIVALDALRVQKDVRTSDVGVVRAGTVVTLPEPWVIDVSHAGNRCVRDGAPVIFWRETSDTATEFAVSPLNRDWRETAPWPKGVDRLPAPRELPIPGRATYLVDIGDGPVAITLITIPATMKNDRMRAAWMFEKACNLQAETLAQTLK